MFVVVTFIDHKLVHMLAGKKKKILTGQMLINMLHSNRVYLGLFQ